VWNIRVALTSESLWQPLGLLLNPAIDFSPFLHRWEQEEKTTLQPGSFTPNPHEKDEAWVSPSPPTPSTPSDFFTFSYQHSLDKNEQHNRESPPWCELFFVLRGNAKMFFCKHVCSDRPRVSQSILWQRYELHAAIPGRRNACLCTSKRPDRLWGPSSRLLNGYWGGGVCFPGNKAVGEWRCPLTSI
jgi:hypothetical protein